MKAHTPKGRGTPRIVASTVLAGGVLATGLLRGRRSGGSGAATEEDTGLGQFARLKVDYAQRVASWDGSPTAPRRAQVISAAINPGFQAVAAHRLSRALYLRGLHTPAWIVHMLNLWLTGAEILPTADIGPGMLVTHPSGVGIWCEAGANLHVNGQCEIGNLEGKRAVLGDDVYLGHASSILGSVTIGDGAIVGAHALVLKDVPARHRAVGIPAKNLPPVAG